MFARFLTLILVTVTAGVASLFLVTGAQAATITIGDREIDSNTQTLKQLAQLGIEHPEAAEAIRQAVADSQYLGARKIRTLKRHISLFKTRQTPHDATDVKTLWFHERLTETPALRLEVIEQIDAFLASETPERRSAFIAKWIASDDREVPQTETLNQLRALCDVVKGNNVDRS